MKGKRWIAVALVCLAGVGIGGCSIFTGAPGDVREESETMGEDGLVVPSASSQEDICAADRNLNSIFPVRPPQ